MRESDFEQEQIAPVKTHEEILELIEEIKEIEREFDNFELEMPSDQKWEPVKPEIIVEEAQPIPIKSEIEEGKKKKHALFRIKRRSKPEVQRIKRQRQYATFKLRLDEQGNLINLDFRKPEPRSKKSKGKFKIPFNLKKLRRRGKEETESTEATPTEEKKGIGGKLKGVLGGISKLKNVIPGRGKKTEKSEKAEETSEEE